MNKKLLCSFAVLAGTLLFSASNGFSLGRYGDDVNTACAPEVVYVGDCSLCHVGDKSASTQATTAFLDGGNALTDFFCSPTTSACTDNDNDNYAVEGGDCGPVDCDDNEAAINPGAVENCTDNVDNDCNGLVDTLDPNAMNCPQCTADADGDGYNIDGGSCGQVDCDDNSADINPGAFEVCDDSIDNDCDGRIDCDDSACTGDPACLAETCADYSDRNSCKADPRCYFSGKDKACLDIEISAAQSDCEASGGRWNKKKGICR